MDQIREIRKIREDRVLKVAGRGGALYLYLPKDFVELYGVIAGDRIEVKLESLYRKTEYIE